MTTADDWRDLQADLDELERTDPAVIAAAAGLTAAAEHILGKLPSEQVKAIYDLDHPYTETLDEAERTGH